MKRIVKTIEVEFTEKATMGLVAGNRKQVPEWLAEKLIESGSAIEVKKEEIIIKKRKNEKNS